MAGFRLGEGKSYTSGMAASDLGGARLLALPLGWLAGVALHLHERTLLPLGAYVALSAAAVVVLVLAAAMRRRGRAIAAIAASVAAGFAISGWQASVRLADTLPDALEGKDLVVTGVVASLPQSGPGGVRFRFVLDDDEAALPRDMPRTLALGWYAGMHEDATLAQPRLGVVPAMT